MFARTLLERAGVRGDIARDVADILLEGDLLGHTTHGLALLPPYLDELAHDRMAKNGEPTVLSSRAAAQIWDGNRLPAVRSEAAFLAHFPLRSAGHCLSKIALLELQHRAMPDRAAYNSWHYHELYDLQEDPGETVNLWEAKGTLKLRSELQAELDGATNRRVRSEPKVSLAG